MTTPLYDAIQVLRTAISAALEPLMGAYVDTAGRPKVYWQRADQEDANRAKITLPYVIYQSQDLGGQADPTVGRLDWQGLVTVKALATSQRATETLMGAILPGLSALQHPGYTITARYIRPVVIPPDGDTWQTAHTWRVYIGA